MEKPNLAYVHSISKGDKAFEILLLTLMKKEFQEEKRGYEKGIKDQDFDLSRIYVHKLKHKMGILGLKDGYQVANRFEEQLMKGSFKSKVAFGAIIEIMDQYLAQI